jgi:hypothetical protein
VQPPVPPLAPVATSPGRRPAASREGRPSPSLALVVARRLASPPHRAALAESRQPRRPPPRATGAPFAGRPSARILAPFGSHATWWTSPALARPASPPPPAGIPPELRRPRPQGPHCETPFLFERFSAKQGYVCKESKTSRGLAAKSNLE